MKQLIENIQVAYASITEAKQVESKFKVGDKVGIGSHVYNGLYASHDTGVVTDVDKQGNHTVTHDKHKVHDLAGSIVPAKSVYNNLGIGQSNRAHISALADHESAVAGTAKSVERTTDLNAILAHLQNARTQNGTFTAPLQKTQVEHFKALLDKHCA